MRKAKFRFDKEREVLGAFFPTPWQRQHMCLQIR